VVIRAALVLLIALTGGCALVLGFEDHEPYPEGEGGAGAGGAGTGGVVTTGGAGGTTTTTTGGMGGVGGEPGTAVLLIADRGEDSVGIYSVEDGTYLGDFVPPVTGTEPYTFSSPNSAVQGPDGRIYVADQIEDHIVCFEADGTFHSIFADASDGLDNVRGLDFRDDILFASVSPAAGAFVARFDSSGNRQADFVADASDPFDVLVLPGGTVMMADIEDPDNVRLYDVDASSFSELLTIDFPQQIQPLGNGNYGVAAWTEVVEMEPDGDVVRTITVDQGRGIYPLENGNWLVSSTAGVEAINPFSKEVIQTPRVGSGFTKIERVVLP
jgi:hypothetical protein